MLQYISKGEDGERYLYDNHTHEIGVEIKLYIIFDETFKLSYKCVSEGEGMGYGGGGSHI